MAKTFICDHCNETYPSEDATYFDEQELCPECLSELTLICHHCDTRIWSRHNVGTAYQPLCQDCYDSYYNTCEDCGAIIHHDNTCYVDDDDDLPYCDNCVGSHAVTGEYIQSYYFRPEPIFYGEGRRFLGVELEIDEGGERNSCAKEIHHIGNQEDDHIYMKHDGSLDDGFEIVTHPMTLGYHREQMPWEEVVTHCRTMGYYSHRTGTCGIHVHVSRNALGETCSEQEDSVARILYFVEAHWNKLLRFSRRTKRQLRKWAARYGRKDSPKEVLDNAKSNGSGRYSCANLTNRDTIEFRIFRGTLKYNTIIATLELVDELCNLAVNYSDKQMQELTWTQFVTNLDCKQYPELI